MTPRIAAIAVALVLAGQSPMVLRAQTITVPTFGNVVVYAPPRAPDQIVLLVSGDGGWNGEAAAMAEQLRDRGALVAGIDIRSFRTSIETAGGCSYPASDLEQLSRAVQLRQKLPTYKRPILAGYASGAALVYAAIAAAPPETFAGAISFGFCPSLETIVEPCEIGGLRTTRRSKGLGYELAPFPDLRVPWIVLQGEADRVCPLAAVREFIGATRAARVISLPQVGHVFGAFDTWAKPLGDAYRGIVSAAQAAPEAPTSVPEVRDLQLVELPAASSNELDTMAILASGDGGWAEFDKGVAAGLAAAGVPTVGWSSLRYYWTPRTPDAAAADLARIITHYTKAWHKDRVLLVGYSFGADVLPFLVNRLPASARARVAGVALLGLSATAVFEFRVAEWIGGGGAREYATVPEVGRVTAPIVCVYGAGEDDAACPTIRDARVRVVSVGQGHHFGSEYDRIVDEILRGIRPARVNPPGATSRATAGASRAGTRERA